MGRVLRIVIAAVAGLLLTGCMSSEPKVAQIDQVNAAQRGAMTATESGSEGGGAAGGVPPFVAVDIDYKSAPEQVAAGPVELELDNEGSIEHDVVIEELGDEKVLDAAAGETDSATVELEPGTYTYYCNVPGHRAAGMEGTLTVE